MTDTTSLVNLALQSFGNRTVITAAQLLAGSNNEAKQANLTFANTRDSLLRLAPWDCGMKTANLVYITSLPGTPENTSPATNLWQPGQPRPPWAYEYQYPIDCLRACWIIPATQTGYAGGIPITTAVTGGAPTSWNGSPIRFKVGIDQFLMFNAIQIITPGSGYRVGDVVTLANESTIARSNPIGAFLAGSPQGAPAKIRVLTVDNSGGAGIGGILTAEVIPQLPDSTYGGSYFYEYTTNIPQGSVSSNVGTGAVFQSNMGHTTIFDQRIILTNQEYATLAYVRQVTDPNVWDPMFQDAFVNALGGDICLALSGDKALAKMCYAKTNETIQQARTADGNEGLTVNDVTPDWIRGRGINWADGMNGSYNSFDWGQFGLYGF